MIILASGSPRRAKILRDLGLEFEIARSDAVEVAYPEEPERTVVENALAKGAAVAGRFRGRPASQPFDILSADTIVWFEGKIYGKPKDLDEAREYLRTLSGKTHIVFTGLALHRLGSAGSSPATGFASPCAPKPSGDTGLAATGFSSAASAVETAVVRSEVKFRELSEARIEEYVARVRPLDRAGAYDIDESGDLIVESYTGSYENIMGLPVEPVRGWLKG